VAKNDLVKIAKQDLDAMQSLGATLVPTDTGNPFDRTSTFTMSDGRWEPKESLC
jgi:hypothetical protein